VLRRRGEEWLAGPGGRSEVVLRNDDRLTVGSTTFLVELSLAAADAGSGYSRMSGISSSIYAATTLECGGKPPLSNRVPGVLARAARRLAGLTPFFASSALPSPVGSTARTSSGSPSPS
jgi:hypothetical protein